MAGSRVQVAIMWIS